MYSKEVLRLVRKLQKARLGLMKARPFDAVLLLHMQFSLDPMCETVYTDGTHIAFCPAFLTSLSDEELEYVLVHEVLHAALGHCGEKLERFDFDDYGTACDVVVNANILRSHDMDLSSITLKNYGTGMHLAPDGSLGCGHTVEEVYRMIRDAKQAGKRDKAVTGGADGAAQEAALVRPDGGFDDHTYWGAGPDGRREECPDDGPGAGPGDESGDEPGDGGTNGGRDGKPKREPKDGGKNGGKNGGKDGGKNGGKDGGKAKRGGKAGDGSASGEEQRDIWRHRILEAAQIARRIAVRKNVSACGTIPLCAERIISELTRPQTDWRTVLDEFVQEEITDYSFAPPDRRFQESPFLLPDYNEKEDSVKDVLFMIDTSASMSDAAITQAYGEICGAIRQFGGRVQGWLGFFDAKVVPPIEFTDEEELKIIRPYGGGGTDFHSIFRWVEEHADELTPTSIVILTDGFAEFPEEKQAMGIPVLWLINNENVDPPWGKVARIKLEEEEE